MATDTIQAAAAPTPPRLPSKLVSLDDLTKGAGRGTTG